VKPYPVRRVVLEQPGRGVEVHTIAGEGDVRDLLDRIRVVFRELAKTERCTGVHMVVHTPGNDCDHEVG